jgi:hypothetical protein
MAKLMLSVYMTGLQIIEFGALPFTPPSFAG